MRSIHSKIWLQSLGWTFWLAFAIASAAWTMHNGGLVRPTAAFAVAITVLGIAMLSPKRVKSRRSWLRAAQYGLASGLVFLLGTLFVEFWWVTVSLACMFAIGRGLSSYDAPAYN